MGNWRTVNMTGTMSTGHARRLQAVLDRLGRLDWPGWGEPYACLSYSTVRPSLGGLGPWPSATVGRRGNLAERGYTVEDVAAALRALVHHAPTMLLKAHCGGEYESSECVATISVGDGLVVAGPPEVATVEGPTAEQVTLNLLRALAAPGPWA